MSKYTEQTKVTFYIISGHEQTFTLEELGYNNDSLNSESDEQVERWLSMDLGEWILSNTKGAWYIP